MGGVLTYSVTGIWNFLKFSCKKFYPTILRVILSSFRVWTSSWEHHQFYNGLRTILLIHDDFIFTKAERNTTNFHLIDVNYGVVQRILGLKYQSSSTIVSSPALFSRVIGVRISTVRVTSQMFLKYLRQISGSIINWFFLQ